MENFLHSIFLNKCYLCELSGEVICKECLGKFITSSMRSNKILSLFQYNDYAKKLLYLSKYPPYYFHLLKFLTNFAIQKYNDEISDFFDFDSNRTILCPIPLSTIKLFERRFNQAQIISDALGLFFRIPSLEILRRVKDTSPLYDLDKYQRRLELEGAFRSSFILEVIRIFKIERVVLVDDLVTTSQTFLMCSKALKNKGIPKVDLITLFSKK